MSFYFGTRVSLWNDAFFGQIKYPILPTLVVEAHWMVDFRLSTQYSQLLSLRHIEWWIWWNVHSPFLFDNVTKMFRQIKNQVLAIIFWPRIRMLTPIPSKTFCSNSVRVQLSQFGSNNFGIILLTCIRIVHLVIVDCINVFLWCFFLDSPPK